MITGHVSAASARRAARLCGVLYLYVIAAGTFAQVFVRGSLVVGTDAEATARNVLANEGLLRLAFSGEFLHLALDVVIAALLYELLRSVDRTVALVAALMRVACDVVLAAAGVTQLVALRLMHGGEILAVLASDARHALALLALRAHGDGYAVSLGSSPSRASRWVGSSSARPTSRGRSGRSSRSRARPISSRASRTCSGSGRGGSTRCSCRSSSELALALWLTVKGVDPQRWEATVCEVGRGLAPER